MNCQEKNIIKQEKKQIKAGLATIRTENNAIGKRLGSMIAIVRSMRASQLGIDVMITEFEEKLGK